MIHRNWFKYDNNISSYQISTYNLSNSFQSKEAWKGVFLDLCLFKYVLNTIFTSRFSISPLICIHFSIELNLNLIIELN